MANASETDIRKLSPDKLLTRFRKSGIALCVLAAFALHVAVLGATSVDYLHGLVDPAWKEKQEQLEEEARKQAEAAKTARARKARVPATTSAPASRPAGKAPAARRPATRPSGGRKLPEPLTTMPKPGEIPKVPGTGIGIDETEGR